MTNARWPDTIDEILDGDHVVMLAYVTPASGVVLIPVTNFAVRDREAGTLTAVNSSVGAWRKLERIRRNPHIALAFHTREHGSSARSEYVLVQGRASLSSPVPDYPTSIIEHWERFEPWRDIGPVWKWWQRAYALRVPIEVAVERVVEWPDLACHGAPEVYGAPLPEPPTSQRPPARGTGPRINHFRAAVRAARLPNVLLGWVGADGFPVVVPVRIDGTEERGIVLADPEGLVPPGSRRAGLTAHWFSRNVIGQNQRKHTGWLEAGPAQGRIVYAPHTKANYRFPTSRIVYRLVAGGATRWGLRGARRAGLPGVRARRSRGRRT
jgi:nitroimidazol reductase NimA-like FMN-containing flavoprotein (pyridoxamine 5'-phosphate oxidase superfamily)